jgi:mRNA-degrading endonuclease toxin of MazEF toxin-antitoxin module
LHVQRPLLEAIKKDRAIKRNSTKTNADVLKEMTLLLPTIESHLKESFVEKSSNWLLFKDLWLQNELGHLRANEQYRNYTRGSIIMSLDWGTSNIGTEIRYPHPGVVLYDQKEDWIIAAPITGAKLHPKTKNPIAHAPFEVLAPKQNKKPKDENEYWFRKHSVIQVDQIQRISKYRAVNKNSYKVRANLLGEIDNLILEYYIPGKQQLLDNLKGVIVQKDADLEAAQKEIQRLKAEIESLKK